MTVGEEGCFLTRPASSGCKVEISWQVFAGEVHELYPAVLKERCEQDKLGTSDEVLARQLRLHPHRGISYLAAPQAVLGLADLVRLVIEQPDGPRKGSGRERGRERGQTRPRKGSDPD